MPRYLKVEIICILFLVFTVPASSELYQYKDENGIMRLTDNIYSVPTKDRSQLEKFSEFEGLSDELEILPIQNKSLPRTKSQSEHQTKTKEIIYPKTSNKIHVTAKTPKEPPLPDAKIKTASESKQKTTDPFQPLVPEKTIQEPDTKVSTREIHKSKKITIDRIDKNGRIDKKVTVQKTAPVISSKSIKKKIGPTATPKTIPEPIIVYKDKPQKIIAKKPDAIPESKTENRKETPSKNITNASQAAAVPKTVQIKPEKKIQKSKQPDAKKPAVSKKAIPKSQPSIAKLSKKSPEVTSVQKTDRKAVAKKESRAKVIVSNKKIAGSQKIKTEPSEKIAKKTTVPEKKSKVAPKIKPEIKPEAKPKTKVADKLPAQKPASTPKKEIRPNTLADVPKTVPATKTAEATAQKDTKKATQPGTHQPDIKEKAFTETKKHGAGISEKKAEIKSTPETGIATVVKKEIKVKNIPEIKNKRDRMPGKKAEIKSGPKKSSSAVAKKEIKTENIITAKKAPLLPKAQTELPKKNIKKDTQTNHTKTKIPEVKPETEVVKKDPTEKITKKPAQPNIKTKAVPEIKKADTDGLSDSFLAKKDSDSVIVASITDSNKLAETKQTTSDNRQITSKEPDLIKSSEQTVHAEKKISRSQMPEADNKRINPKDESIILAKLESTRRVLFNKKEALNKKFASLMKEKQEIANSLNEDDEKSVLIYNEHVKKLNIKIKQYKKEKKRLQATINEYNNTIKQSALN